MRYRMVVLLLVTVPLLVVAGVAAAHRDKGDLDRVKRATAAFHDVDAAIAAGYSLRLPEIGGNTCIVEEGVGGMGVHMVNTSLLDSELKATEPEVLVYDPRIRRDGTEKLRLVAVEYVVFQSAWTGKRPPKLHRADVRLRSRAEPLRPAGVLRTSRVGLEAKPERGLLRLEPARSLLASHDESTAAVSGARHRTRPLRSGVPRPSRPLRCRPERSAGPAPVPWVGAETGSNGVVDDVLRGIPELSLVLDAL